MKITVQPKVGDYYILEVYVTDAMIAEDLWGLTWFPEIEDWCTDSFGDQDIWGENPISGWKRMINRYFFTKEDMCSIFILKWGGDDI